MFISYWHKTLFISYWHKTGIDIFRVKGAETIKVASGDLDSLKPVKTIGKKVLIVAREMLLHIRKRYPPTTEKNLKKAIQMEIRDIFPLENPAFSFRIFEKTSAYCLVDMWGWDSSQYEKIKKVFSFTHVLPEDMALVSEEPEVSVFEQNGLKNLIAHNKNGFIGGLSTRTLTEETLEIFLHSLGRYASEVKRIKIYDTKEISDKNSINTIPLVYEERKDHPVFLRDLSRLDLREFKVRGEKPFKLDIRFALRVVIYLLIIYSLSLYINKRYYEAAIDEVSKRLDALKKVEQSSLKKEGQRDEYSGVINEFKEKRRTKLDALLIMDSLAQSIPEGSYLTRMVLSEGSIELSFSSKDPLDVIKSLSTARCVKSLKLKGAPAKTGKETFNFLLLLELMPCQ